MSLAQEVKDFLAGWQMVDEMGQKRADRKAAGEKAQADKEYRDALLAIRQEELALRKARGAGGGGSGSGGGRPMTEYQRAMLGLRERELKLKEGAAEGKAADAAISGVDDSEFNIDDYYDLEGDGATTSAIPEDPPLVSDEELEPGYARGGLVAHAAEGGLLETPPATKPKPRPAAIPEEPKVEKPAAEKPAAQPAEPAAEQPASNPTKLIVAKAGEAAEAAMRTFVVDSKKTRGAIATENPDMDISTNTGGMTLDEYQAVIDKVDPNDEMPTHLKNTAALGAAYDYFMAKGQTDKAVRAARGFLIANKNATQALGALTVQALEDGNIEDACRLFNDACNRFPSGHEIMVTPDPRKGLVYTVKDEGKVVEQGAIDATKLYELSGKVADGSLYVDQMARFAAKHGDTKPKQGFGAALEGVTQSYGTLVAANDAYTSLGEDASFEERQKAYKELQAANEQFNAARTSALEIGNKGFDGKGNRDAHEAKVKSIVDRSMRAPDAALTMPPPPEEPKPGMIESAVGAIGSMFSGGEDAPAAKAPNRSDVAPKAPGAKEAVPVTSGGKALPPDVAASAKAAIAQGASREAVIKRLQENGFSTDGF